MAAGRPTKLTPELQAAYIAALRRVWYLDTAADLAGIHRMSVARWIKRGRREKAGPYRAFSDAVRQVLAEAEGEQLDLIRAAARQQWQAAAWALERRSPERWGAMARDVRELQKRLAELEKARGVAPSSDPPPAGQA